MLLESLSSQHIIETKMIQMFFLFIKDVKDLSDKLCNQKFNKSNLFHQINLFSKASNEILEKFWRFISVKDFY